MTANMTAATEGANNMSRGEQHVTVLSNFLILLKFWGLECSS